MYEISKGYWDFWDFLGFLEISDQGAQDFPGWITPRLKPYSSFRTTILGLWVPSKKTSYLFLLVIFWARRPVFNVLWSNGPIFKVLRSVFAHVFDVNKMFCYLLLLFVCIACALNNWIRIRIRIRITEMMKSLQIVSIFIYSKKI